ncbi:hypothetical protein [uncultured Tolumonas sp.]|uniref:hypothetical protein n=1 Tax=uncultured Tolumonas sp. TaxID=263765 RepID=UPI00292FEDCF|nr:hypothetical protein [uncultured Tolumonas sp.]
MKKVIAASLVFVSFTTLAHMNCLVGNYVNAKGEKIFSLSAQHHSGVLSNLQTGEHITVSMMKEKQILSVWKRMQWSKESASDAECAADKAMKHIVCELSNADAEPKFNHSPNIYLNSKDELTLLRRKE